MSLNAHDAPHEKQSERRPAHTKPRATSRFAFHPKRTAAIIDRLTYHGTIIETGTRSYRLAHSTSAGTGDLGEI
ncbi:hypothetical protein FGL98_24725 [Leekyejoonella antrihumi]|uniref:Uncharacterized protein n=1 Tax=Leekyejoonella antrihumi TaxID=1660198 RepID=A0A563DQT9_9MICO|nr:hypothetical protein FGL98_24725 [Leekyejoonella antrihumi]